MAPLLSVIVPVRDRARLLGEAIGSLLAGGWNELEVIVVDDGSTDGSAEVAASFPGVRCLRREPRGVASARNAGVAAARGSLLGFLDSDDLRVAGTLALQVEALERRPGAGLVFGHLVEFAGPAANRGRPVAPADPRPRAGYIAGAMLARRTEVAAVGAFDETLQVGEFVDWLARARDLGVGSALIDEVVLRRRLHSDHLSARAALRVDFVRVARAHLERRRAAKGRG